MPGDKWKITDLTFKEKPVPLFEELNEERIEALKKDDPKSAKVILDFYNARSNVRLFVKKVKLDQRNAWQRKLTALNAVKAQKIENPPTTIEAFEAWLKEDEDGRDKLYRDILMKTLVRVEGLDLEGVPPEVLCPDESNLPRLVEVLEDISALYLAGEAARKAQFPTEKQGES